MARLYPKHTSQPSGVVPEAPGQARLFPSSFSRLQEFALAISTTISLLAARAGSLLPTFAWPFRGIFGKPRRESERDLVRLEGFLQLIVDGTLLIFGGSPPAGSCEPSTACLLLPVVTLSTGPAAQLHDWAKTKARPRRLNASCSCRALLAGSSKGERSSLTTSLEASSSTILLGVLLLRTSCGRNVLQLILLLDLGRQVEKSVPWLQGFADMEPNETCL